MPRKAAPKVWHPTRKPIDLDALELELHEKRFKDMRLADIARRAFPPLIAELRELRKRVGK